MNTKNLKAYAPKARSQFIEAIKKRAAQFGIYEDKIADIQFEGSTAIIEGRAFTKQQGEQRKRLEQKVQERGYGMFIREISYTWFNRLAAIRYMELHDYFDHGFRVLSHPNSQDQLPEILDNASDVADMLALDKSHITELQLAGDKEEELYRELLLGQCHYLYKVMPFMFERLDDASELLLPDNLTKTDSILKGLVNEIPEEDWGEIEVIGWLYQFYISEHKDSVIGKVVKSEDIPAATQLFTPNWIVKYIVQNSLGRQWLATYPDSEIKGKMEYYIEPAEQSDDVITQLKAITPTSIDPEQIKVLDPAAGSGHILVEVYEVLREIYLERGYRLREIPELILTKNIYGLDIDDRAAQLASFALMMKAREDDRRIFQRVEDGEVTLNVYSLQSTEGLDIGKLWRALDIEDKQQQGSTGGIFDTLDDEEGFVPPTGVYKEYFELIQTLKSAFLQAKTLGSLIQIDNFHLQNLVALKELLQAKESGSDPSAKQAASDLLPIVNQAIVLAQQYDVVVANPPYMGKNGMNSDVKKFVQKNHPNSKSDLFSVYIEKCLQLGNKNAEIGMVTPYVWMFISSYQLLRESLLSNHTLNSLVQLEYNAFAPACIPVCTFTISKSFIKEYKSCFIKLSEFKGHETQAPKTLEAINNRGCGWFFEAILSNFIQIPGNPIGYWINDELRMAFSKGTSMGELASPRQGMATSDNDRFLRCWYEVSLFKTGFDINSRDEAKDKGLKWFPYNKGGAFKKWYGNNQFVVNWENDGKELLEFAAKLYGSPTRTIKNMNYYFESSITWSALSSGGISLRYTPKGFLFDTKGQCIFYTINKNTLLYLMGILNSEAASEFMQVLAPTLDFNSGTVAKVPVISDAKERAKITENARELMTISKDDWNSYETSWDFKKPSIINDVDIGIKNSFIELLSSNKSIIEQIVELETSNNNLVADAFDLIGLKGSSLEEVKVTIKSNPIYRYGEKESSPNSRYQSDTLCELISYSLGCMMGRYSLDRDGLVYANTSNNDFQALTEGAYTTFPADDDGIVPLASEDWLFGDDATSRFREFVKTVWGDEHLQENLEFVAESLCLHALKPVKGESPNDTVRRYFSKQFYKDHCKTYKKRPIYWLFSSGKEKAFECLVYLHRYNEGTLARMRTEYVTPLMGKYDQQQSMLSEQIIEASNTEKRSIEKDLKTLEKKQAELRTFDEQLKHYAEMRITLDLDDGVKANYGKFGNLLADVKTIHGQLPEKII